MSEDYAAGYNVGFAEGLKTGVDPQRNRRIDRLVTLQGQAINGMLVARHNDNDTGIINRAMSLALQGLAAIESRESEAPR